MIKITCYFYPTHRISHRDCQSNFSCHSLALQCNRYIPWFVYSMVILTLQLHSFTWSVRNSLIYQHLVFVELFIPVFKQICNDWCDWLILILRHEMWRKVDNLVKWVWVISGYWIIFHVAKMHRFSYNVYQWLNDMSRQKNWQFMQIAVQTTKQIWSSIQI